MDKLERCPSHPPQLRTTSADWERGHREPPAPAPAAHDSASKEGIKVSKDQGCRTASASPPDGEKCPIQARSRIFSRALPTRPHPARQPIPRPAPRPDRDQGRRLPHKPSFRHREPPAPAPAGARFRQCVRVGSWPKLESGLIWAGGLDQVEAVPPRRSHCRDADLPLFGPRSGLSLPREDAGCQPGHETAKRMRPKNASSNFQRPPDFA